MCRVHWLRSRGRMGIIRRRHGCLWIHGTRSIESCVKHLFVAPTCQMDWPQWQETTRGCWPIGVRPIRRGQDACFVIGLKSISFYTSWTVSSWNLKKKRKWISGFQTFIGKVQADYGRFHILHAHGHTKTFYHLDFRTVTLQLNTQAFSVEATFDSYIIIIFKKFKYGYYTYWVSSNLFMLSQKFYYFRMAIMGCPKNWSISL